MNLYEQSPRGSTQQCEISKLGSRCGLGLKVRADMLGDLAKARGSNYIEKSLEDLKLGIELGRFLFKFT